MGRTGELTPVLEIGGTHVTAALVDGTRVVTSVRRELDAQAARVELLVEIVGAARDVRPPAGVAWGVAIPGPFDVGAGIALYAEDKFTSLHGVDVGAALRDFLRAPVHFVNDADAFALGEWALLGSTSRRFVALTLGTGVGSGWIADGRVALDGPGVPPGGEAWLLSYRGHPLEDTFSRRAIRAAYGGGLDVREICARATEGDAMATDVLRAATTGLGDALAPHLAEFGADTVVVGGSMAGSWELLGPWFAAAAGLPAQRAEDAERAALVGAALCAR